MRLQSLAFGCLLLTACGQSHGPTPHTLRYATGADISSLNPHLDSQGAVAFLSSMTMAFLVKYDRHNQPYPELATEIPAYTNGGVSRDGLTITYHLRKGVTWSDGAPFTADDVAFSVGVVLNPANNEVTRSGWDLIGKADEPDRYTVRFHLKRPYSPFLETFFSSAGGLCVLPKYLLAGLSNINHAAYNDLPVGIGPFKYREWLRGQRVVLVANRSYFRGLPRLKEVRFEIITDANTLATRMQTHELDMWYRVPASYYQRLKDAPGLTSLEHPGFEFNHLDFNASRSVLRDPAVRLALEYAIDRKMIRQKVAHGMGVVQEEPAPPIAAYYVPALAKARAFGLAKANALLDTAGWRRGSDGVRSRGGVRLELELALGVGNADADREVELLRQWWRAIGVALTAKHYNSALLFAAASDGGIIEGGRFDIALINSGVDPIGDFSSLYACDQAAPGGQNDTHWCNRAADAAMRDLFRQYTVEGRRADDAILMRELQRDVPTVIMSIPEATFIYSKAVRNFHPGAVTSFDNMMDVDI